MTYARGCRRCKPLVVSALGVFFCQAKRKCFFRDFVVDFFADCAILFAVMRDILLPKSFKGFMTDNQFRKLAEDRMAMMKEWKAIPESTRPTWEEFKRGFKVKKATKKG
jgi:hypothetical protein